MKIRTFDERKACLHDKLWNSRFSLKDICRDCGADYNRAIGFKRGRDNLSEDEINKLLNAYDKFKEQE